MGIVGSIEYRVHVKCSKNLWFFACYLPASMQKKSIKTGFHSRR